jgi:hypothetical protein
MNAATKMSKKRKRLEKLQQYGVDLPEIPGVPVEVIPLLVHALKTSTKFFQQESSSAYNQDWDEEEEDLSQPRRTNVQASALESVFSRLDSTAQNSEQVQQQKHRNEKMKDAANSWLQSVKRNATKGQRHDPKMPIFTDPSIHNGATNSQQPMREKNFRSVPLSCFVYILNLSQEHSRLAVRRAALYLNRLLLDKSADCRRFFLEEDNHLWQWVQVLCADHKDFDPAKQRLWQREGHLLLLKLLKEHYDELYPKLGVAEQYLRQSCLLQQDNYHSSSAALPEDDGTTTNMTSLRKLRDIAIEHGAEELRRIEVLLQRSHNCMNVLVPRIGDDNSSNIDNTFSTKRISMEAAAMPTIDSLGIPTDGDEDDEDNDIDWEDGWEGDEEAVHNDENCHAKAVERTLEAMAAMGGFRTEGLQIDFDVAQSDTHPTLSGSAISNSEETEKARERFTKCARFLSDRHLPRIGAWLEGLTKADRLYSPPSAAGKQGRSLLLMSPQQGQERDELRDKLIHCKAQVRTVLKSASQLGLCALKD